MLKYFMYYQLTGNQLILRRAINAILCVPENGDVVGMGHVQTHPRLFAKHVRVKAFRAHQRDLVFQVLSQANQTVPFGFQCGSPFVYRPVGIEAVIAMDGMIREIRHHTEASDRYEKVAQLELPGDQGKLRGTRE